MIEKCIGGKEYSAEMFLNTYGHLIYDKVTLQHRKGKTGLSNKPYYVNEISKWEENIS